MTLRILICIFCIFILVGLGLAAYGFTKLAQFNFAEQFQATVVSAQYNAGEMDVTFIFTRNSESIQTNAHFYDIRYENGRLPYYEGQNTIIRVDGSNKILQFGKREIIVTVAGFVFAAVGIGFIFFMLRKKQNFDIACDYKRAIVASGNEIDETVNYEADAEILTHLPQTSANRKVKEIEIWKKRIKDRFKVFTLRENLLYGSLLILPMIIISILPVFNNKTVTFGYIICSVLIWLFVYCFAGTMLKIIRSAYYKLLVKRGKFNEKRYATVVCSAFESSSQIESGDFSPTYTLAKKFRVIALIDGKRSVGYVKGVVPPMQGTVLKVLIRKNRTNRWIIDDK
ncbi:MAG: hypothetical protein NC132_00840 [Corallococcus sp.]|nr:hypothetical protein [Corallococcus sp.]MCM1359263.1 hypothetical protein [Corallococcus sp.]MCM1394654.1 hypothetical protein [Corallococcus sp.]